MLSRQVVEYTNYPAFLNILRTIWHDDGFRHLFDSRLVGTMALCIGMQVTVVVIKIFAEEICEYLHGQGVTVRMVFWMRY